MREKYRQKIQRTQNEALQRRTGKGRFALSHPRSIFRAPTIPTRKATVVDLLLTMGMKG